MEENPSTQAKLLYKKRQKEKKKSYQFNQSILLPLHMWYICLTAPNVTSPPPGMETFQVANLCMCVFKFQIKLLSVLKLL